MISAASIADRHRRVQLAARCLQTQRLLGALPKHRELELAECTLQAQQQPIVDRSGIIDPVLIDDQAVHNDTEFQQRMPVAAVASQTRSLYRQHRARGTGADCCKQTLEAGPGSAAARTTKIIVDDDDILPTEGARSRLQGILPASALGVVEKLVRR